MNTLYLPHLRVCQVELLQFLVILAAHLVTPGKRRLKLLREGRSGIEWVS